MSDPTPSPAGNSSGRDHLRIDPADDADVHTWADKLDVTAEQVRDAVKAVGTAADDVEMHLKGSRSTTNSEQTANNG